MDNRKNIKNIVISGLLIAIGIIVPAIFHYSGISGKVFLPMHIPVLIGGFLLSPMYALLVGVVTPLLNSLLTGMPPAFPMALIMMFELGVYGLIASLFYRKLKLPLIVSLILSLVAGRVMAALVVYFLVMVFAIKFASPLAFIKGGVMLGFPGIIIQIILIPILMLGINKYTTINLD